LTTSTKYYSTKCGIDSYVHTYTHIGFLSPSSSTKSLSTSSSSSHHHHHHQHHQQVSNHWHSIDDKTAEKVRNMKRPTSTKELGSTLCKLNWLRPYVQSFGQIAAPLYHFTSTMYDKKKIIWSDERMPMSAKQIDGSVLIEVSHWHDLLNACIIIIRKEKICFVVEMLQTLVGDLLFFSCREMTCILMMKHPILMVFLSNNIY